MKGGTITIGQVTYKIAKRDAVRSLDDLRRASGRSLDLRQVMHGHAHGHSAACFFSSRINSRPHRTVALTSVPSAGVNRTTMLPRAETPLNSLMSVRLGPPASLAMSKSVRTRLPAISTW